MVTYRTEIKVAKAPLSLWGVSDPSEKGHEQGLFEAQQSCVELDPVSFQHVCFADNMHGPKRKKNECVALAPSGDCETRRKRAACARRCLRSLGGVSRGEAIVAE